MAGAELTGQWRGLKVRVSGWAERTGQWRGLNVRVSGGERTGQ